MKKNAIVALVMLINIAIIALLIMNVKSMVKKIEEKNIEEQGIISSEGENSLNLNVPLQQSTSQHNAFTIQDMVKIMLLGIGMILATISGFIFTQLR